MILFPPAKINLGLNILFKREDAYHEIDSVMLPIPMYDVLEILPAEQFDFHQSGLTIDGGTSDNLCVKAYNLLKEKYTIPPVYIHLRKEIPMGAGLGGGSADAAYVLKGLNELFELNCSNEELESLALQLGSDCPFFIKNTAQVAKGRGEVLSPCQLDLKGYFLKIVNPGIHVGTKEAYAGVIFKDSKRDVKEIVEGPISAWKDELINDFERSVFQHHSVLADIKSMLYQEGAVYASMSGSGSTMFAIYEKEPSLSFTATSYLEKIVQL
jgi:4-diphosphocytidyl-2-C-methyl-D-erythritol kinase